MYQFVHLVTRRTSSARIVVGTVLAEQIPGKGNSHWQFTGSFRTTEQQCVRDCPLTHHIQQSGFYIVLSNYILEVHLY